MPFCSTFLWLQCYMLILIIIYWLIIVWLLKWYSVKVLRNTEIKSYLYTKVIWYYRIFDVNKFFLSDLHHSLINKSENPFRILNYAFKKIIHLFQYRYLCIVFLICSLFFSWMNTLLCFSIFFNSVKSYITYYIINNIQNFNSAKTCCTCFFDQYFSRR